MSDNLPTEDHMVLHHTARLVLVLSTRLAAQSEAILKLADEVHDLESRLAMIEGSLIRPDN